MMAHVSMFVFTQWIANLSARFFSPAFVVRIMCLHLFDCFSFSCVVPCVSVSRFLTFVVAFFCLFVSLFRRSVLRFFLFLCFFVYWFVRSFPSAGHVFHDWFQDLQYHTISYMCIPYHTMQSAENGPQDGSTNSQVLNAKNYKNCQLVPNLVACSHNPPSRAVGKGSGHR